MKNKIKKRLTKELLALIKGSKKDKNGFITENSVYKDSAWYKEIERELNRRGVNY